MRTISAVPDDRQVSPFIAKRCHSSERTNRLFVANNCHLRIAEVALSVLPARVKVPEQIPKSVLQIAFWHKKC